MPWTEKQEQVIKERDKTILVSAAAGSGKTATLVERIYQKIIDTEHPVDITSFLVVTFTKAAAAQMKEKLLKKLEEAQEQYPESEHIAKQNMLIQSADITTIDSFCLNIVKEYFSFLNLDPSVGIGDPGMLEMLKYDVMTELFETKYAQLQEQPDTEFGRLLELFCDGKRDDNLKDVIDKIYQQITSFPDPSRFLEEARAALRIETAEDLNRAAWMQAMLDILHKKATASILLAQRCLALCGEADGPEQYREQIVSDIEKLQAIEQADRYAAMKQVLDTKWATLSRKKFTGDKELQEACKALRKEYKDEFDSKKLDGFKQSETEILEDMALLKSYLLPLLSLTEEFMTLFMEEKQKRKMLEFSDISHMAYQLVCAGYDADGCAIPTEIGKTISNRYEEIYIDEYQDSNYLQEDILTAVSGKSRGDYNMFMVGDVKQSIYRFRMARPEIFVKKYNRYQETGKEIKIELNHNFRSRAVVLRSINYFFYQLMGSDLGGITYDDRQALVPGKQFPEPPEGISVSDHTELLLADVDDIGNLSEDALRQYGSPDKDALEGYLIANRIRAMMDAKTGMQVYDEELDRYRPVQYKDIVILARSLKDYGDSLYNALMAQGIPVYLEKSKGYFQAVEIQVIMSMLSVVDNSRQDIPLSAVLLSPIGGLNESELAEICTSVRNAVSEKLCLYEICEYYAEDCEETVLGAKLCRVLSLIDELKEKKQHLSVSDLIWVLLQKTGYYEYVTAMPAGDIRKSNVDMLLQKAVQFENGYYKGLFHFLRYVDKLKLMEKDEGEASVLSEDADVVRIMSIHKSKGLEYPVVFAAGMGRQFNRMELKDNVQVHPDYYLAAMAMYTTGRYKHNTTIRSIYASLEDVEMMAENLRVLYVAMTRAKEKLILTGTVRGADRLLAKYAYVADMEAMLLPYNVRKNADCYAKQLFACMMRYNQLADAYKVQGAIRMEILNQEEILTAMLPMQIQSRLQVEEIRRMAQQTEESVFYKKNEESFSFEYPHMEMTTLGAKLSISDIKKMKAYDGKGYDISTEFAQPDSGRQANTKRTNKQEVRPRGTLTGSERGTIVHKFMELLPFEAVNADDDLDTFIKQQKVNLYQRGILEERELVAIRESKIRKMLQSALGCRMIEAARLGNLYKERQFSAGIPASEVYDVAEMDMLVVQGIIDAYFYEDDGVVVMDYKTDAADEETLVGRYRAQLAAYAEVLERLTGKKVKEQVIYSFHLDKMIRL